LQLYLQRY